MTEDDTFNELKYGKYKLTVAILPDHDYQVDDILDGLRTTLPDSPLYNQIDDNGNCVSIVDIDELAAELFCLGICYREIEDNLDMSHPFDYNIERMW